MLRAGFNSEVMFEARVSHYSWASEMVEKGQFETPKDKMIWENYSEGLSRTQIAERIGLERSWINRKISMIEKYLKSPLQTLASSSFAVA